MSSSHDDVHVEEVSLYFVLFAALLSLVIILSKVLHDRPRLNSMLSEASLTLLVGKGAGFLVHVWFLRRPFIVDEENELEAQVVASSLLSFDANVFFLALLP